MCGVLGGRGHWTDDTFPNRGAPTLRAERQRRMRLANAVLGPYGLALTDWTGASYVLATRTGRTAMVDDLTELWAAAEDLTGRRCDPLDEALLARLSG